MLLCKQISLLLYRIVRLVGISLSMMETQHQVDRMTMVLRVLGSLQWHGMESVEWVWHQESVS